MKAWFKNFVQSDSFLSFSSSLIAIVIGLLFGFIILFISNSQQAVNGFVTILSGGFAGGAKGLGDTLYFATPIILTGLSVGFAFKTGLFNIGASGQFYVGAYCAVVVGIKATYFGSVHWVVALFAAMVGGALWALIPGLLKAFLNVNEVISTIMMNYIGLYLVNMLTKFDKTIFDTLKNQSKLLPKSSTIPKLGLNEIFAGSSVNAGIFIAIAVVIIVYFVLYKTVFGFELRACGFNRHASKYAGINEKRSIATSMVIAGALAGLGGGLLLLAGSGKHIEVIDILPNEGFLGIPVALLGLSNPIGILFSGVFISYLTQGGFYMQLYNFTPEIINIIVSAIVYFSAFALIVKKFVERRRMSRLTDKNVDNINAPQSTKDAKKGKEGS